MNGNSEFFLIIDKYPVQYVATTVKGELASMTVYALEPRTLDEARFEDLVERHGHEEVVLDLRDEVYETVRVDVLVDDMRDGNLMCQICQHRVRSPIPGTNKCNCDFRFV
jgi:hypothetical protein